jgi:hypothetical protein
MAEVNDTKFDVRRHAQRLINAGHSPNTAWKAAEEMAKSHTKEPKTVKAVSSAPLKKKSIDDYVAEALALDEDEAQRAGAIGYMARAMVQATMPHSRVEGSEFERRNGNFFISMLAPSRIGLPYGALPRLIMAWMTGEVVRTKNRELVLGDSLSAFMRELHLLPTGGRWGSITRIKNQMNRLLACSVTCTYDNGVNFALKHITPVENAVLWWDPKDPEQKSLWESTLTLSERFFEEVTASPVPVNMRTLEALRGSSMNLDIYCWLTYRNFYAKRPSRIPWETLQAQFGAGYPETALGKRHFKSKFLEALKKVGIAYPEAQRLQAETDVLVYVPGYPDVAPLVPKES